MSSSHYKAVVPKKADKHKLSYRMVYINEYCNNIKEMRQIVISHKLPKLSELLLGLIEVSEETSENCLNVDCSVYRNGLGKMSC